MRPILLRLAENHLWKFEPEHNAAGKKPPQNILFLQSQFIPPKLFTARPIIFHANISSEVQVSNKTRLV